MTPIYHRYGATLELPVEIDDLTATSVTLYIGKEGTTAEVSKQATVTQGVGTIIVPAGEMMFPLGQYKWQLNVDYSDGRKEKFPTTSNYSEELPDFFMLEALDEQEVTA